MEMCTPTGGVINPGNFPVPTTDPDELETLAASLRTDGETVSGIGADIKSAWAGLTSCYSAPEAAELYAVVNPVATDGDAVESGMDSAATALETFAGEVRDIKARWAVLTTDANGFLASIEGDDDWRSPDTWSWEWWSGGESPKVAEHQALLDRADQLRQDFEAAEVTCANAINAGIPGRTSFVHSDGGEPGANEFAHGYDGYLGDVPMAWGGPVETDDAWFVDLGNSVKDFGVGALEDLGGMLGMHSSEGWFQMSWGDALWENYEGALQGAASLVGMYDSESGDWGWAGWDNVGSAWRDAAHAVVPWEEWGERPWYVIGTAALNIGATVGGALLTATGVGAVVGVPLMAWRGSAILGKLGGGRGPDVDLPDGGTPDLTVHLNLPRFAGGPRELFTVDLSRLDLAGVSPSRMADMRGALERLVNRFGVGDGPTDGADAPRSDRRYGDGGEDPTTQDLADTVTVEDVLNPASPEATRLRDRYQGEFLENDLRSQDGWEASQTGRNDGPEPDREPALIGPRADTADATATPDTPPVQRVDLTGDGGLDDLPDHRRGDVDASDRNPDVTNSVDTADLAGPRDTGGVGPSNGAHASVPGDGSPDGDQTGGRGPTSMGGDLTTRGNGGANGSGNGGDGQTPPRSEPIDLGDPDGLSPRLRALVPGEGQRFGDGVRLDPNTRYELIEADGTRRTEYITDDQGNIREIRAGSDGWNANHPEFRNPRPDMTYVVDDRYTYRTDGLGRTESAEGTLRRGANVRNDDEQGVVNAQGRTYFQELNEQLRDEFERREGRPPEPGEVPQYQDIQWNGGHLIGSAEFFGIGERLNQVPMRFDVNQNRTETALPDIPEEARGGIDGSFRNLERSWRGIMRDGAGWHRFNDPRFNDGTWGAALDIDRANPRIDVRINGVYDPDLRPVPDPDNPGSMIPPPPSRIEVEWTLNGVRMRTQEYNNLPPLVNPGE
ncbi:hypothetical protein ACIBFB_23820 [Nocardiopsis sp. NPDC050513]|uniref:hypothetical protein n=1 Tax=Nocardiopsis sp. NPDC050513 TaxID=3364338 RepID=UPI00378A7D71